MAQRIECGFYHLAETKVFHYAGYECAAWWQDVEVEAGDYPVFAVIEEDTIRWFLVTLPGVVVADNFQALYCGTRIGKPYDEAQNAGKGAEYHIQSNDYPVFESMRKDTNSPWHIDLVNLPNLHICSDCGATICRAPQSFTAQRRDNRRCPSCSVKASEIRRKAINLRHGFLISAARAAGRHIGEFTSVFDRSLDEYLESGRQDGYHRDQIVKNINRLRTYRRLMKDQVANADTLRRMAWER
jgi:hypothetical protein